MRASFFLSWHIDRDTKFDFKQYITDSMVRHPLLPLRPASLVILFKIACDIQPVTFMALASPYLKE